jgi:hypothetical protein
VKARPPRPKFLPEADVSAPSPSPLVCGDFAISHQQWSVSLSRYLDLHVLEFDRIQTDDLAWFIAHPKRRWRVRPCVPFERQGLFGLCTHVTVERKRRTAVHYPMGIPPFLMPSLADDDAFGASVDSLFKVGMPCKPSKFPMRKNQCSAKVLGEFEVKTIEAESKDDG